MYRLTVGLSVLISVALVACSKKSLVAPVAEPAVEYVTETTASVHRYEPADLDRSAISAVPAGERYAQVAENPVQRVAENPVSTFSIDVDSGSYSNLRRMLNYGQIPPAGAVRAEEIINYFDYGYAPPTSPDHAFSVHTEVAPAPWQQDRHLLLIGLKGYDVPADEMPSANVVYLIDTSGSMAPREKLPLLKDAFKQMVPRLRARDRVSIVVYAGAAGVVLEPTPGNDERTILRALDRLEAGGSTNGGAGIQLAYQLARKAYIDGGINRVILATDGDFNVGVSDLDSLKAMVTRERESGISLTTLGFGQDNYNDALAEQLADIGNGNHAYIDTLNEAHKVFGEELASTLFTIASDVKVQVEFNPAQVAEYRLIGYENRLLAREDFNNDRVDAGEIGAGHDVTALYEIALVDSAAKQVDALRYAEATTSAAVRPGDELAFVKLRYKPAQHEASRLVSVPIERSSIAATPGARLALAAAAAAFADQLRGGPHLAGFGYGDVAALARSSTLPDRYGYRAEFLELIAKAEAMSRSVAAAK